MVFAFARHWIAGENLRDAIERVRTDNKKKINGMVNFLGEETIDKEHVERIVKEYMEILDSIENLKSAISLKLTQLGLLLNKGHCLHNLSNITKHAFDLKKFVWIDMEKSSFVNHTIEIYLHLSEDFPNIGLTVQASLRRSKKDLIKLLKKQAIIRLVKGAYHESKDVAFQNKGEIDRNYVKLMEILFNKSERFAIATHDERLIEKAISFGMETEFQFLMGIKENIKERLAKKYKVSEYIPYGTHWLPYVLRRIREHPTSLLKIL